MGVRFLRPLDGEFSAGLDDLQSLAHHLFQLAAGAEGRDDLAGHHQPLAGLRVDAAAAAACPGHKAAKPGDAHGLTLSDRLGDRVEDRVDGFARGALGHARPLGNCLDELCFVHSEPPLVVAKIAVL